MFNEAQLDVVHSDDNILVCATAGSGKTSVLAEKTKKILRTHPDPHIILVTFSREAANEMSARIRHSKISPPVHPSLLRRVTFGTYHSLALAQLRAAGKVCKILSGLELRHAVQRSLWDAKLKIAPDAAAEMIATCKCNPTYDAENPEISDLAAIYQSHLEAMGGMDFTDILLKANRLMKAGKRPPLYATHVLADEYQDTDAIQAEWLEHHITGGRVACAVGDDDQSIYAFRRSLGYRGMQRFIHATQARIIKLDTNYRSTAGIVFTAGRLIANNGDRIQKDFKVARGDGPLPMLVTLEKGKDQADEIVNRIIQLCKDNPRPDDPNYTYAIAVREGEAAILSRTNLQLDVMEDACRRMDIPFYRNGSLFWDLKVLQVFLMLLQSLDKREGSGLEIGLRWAGIGDSAVRKMSALASNNIWAFAHPNGVELPATMSRHAGELFRCFRSYAPNRSGERGSGAVAAIDAVAGWMRSVLSGDNPFPVKSSNTTPPKPREVSPAARSALKILEIGRSSLCKYEGSLKSRVNKVQSGSDRKDKCGVALATFHASKGMEYKHVFLTDIDAGSVPPSEVEGSLEALEEERRIFFVAMTRARDTLTMFRNCDLPISEFLRDANLHPIG